MSLTGALPLRERMGIGSIRLILLALTVCVVWLTIEDRWGSSFSIPTRYRGDAHYILGMMKLAKDGDLGLFTHITTKSLGAPFIGQLNDFPEAERVIVWLGGQIARVIGLNQAANTMLIPSCIVAAFSFYAAARLWRISRLSSWIFAIAYAFLPHNQRSLESLGIIFTGLLPLQLYACWYVATAQRMTFRSSQFRWGTAVGFLSGLLNIYWIFLFLQLYVLALLYRILRRKPNVILAVFPFLAACCTAGLSLGSFIVYRVRHGSNIAALIRSYFDVERYSLKPVELFIPRWGKYFSCCSDFFSRYYDADKINIGEHWWGAYIGILAILGLLFLFFRAIQNQLKRRAPSLPFLAACWIIAYASFGGGHAMFSLISGFYNIRATNRYCVAIATIGFLYFVFVMHRFILGWPFRARLSSLIVVSFLAIMDQSFSNYLYPRYTVPTNVIKERMLADKDLALKLEDRLATGAMIYMLPVLDFPEPFSGPGMYRIDLSSIYVSMRPFLYSSALRYSYGSNKGREGADWQLGVQELPAREMAAMLQDYGFSGILLNRRGYPDQGEKLLADFRDAGFPIEFEQGIDNEWVFVGLTPSESPQLPTTTPYALSVKK